MADNQTSPESSSTGAGDDDAARGNDSAYDPDIVAQLGTSTGSEASAPERAADFGDASHPTSLGVSDGMPAERLSDHAVGGDAGAEEDSSGT